MIKAQGLKLPSGEFEVKIHLQDGLVTYTGVGRDFDRFVALKNAVNHAVDAQQTGIVIASMLGSRV